VCGQNGVKFSDKQLKMLDRRTGGQLRRKIFYVDTGRPNGLNVETKQLMLLTTLN